MIGLLATLAALTAAPSTMELNREFRGAWIATVDNIDWPSRRDLSTEQQRTELTRILDRAAEMRLNAVIFQVRPTADSLYKSAIEPWSEYLTGQQGRAPSPEWDPLAFVIEEGHRRGIEVHAWFNPYRSWHPAGRSTPAANHISQTHPDSVHQYGRFQWMDPADPFVQQRTLDVMLDVVRRYDVDGVHIDDYFYPYPDRDAQGNRLEFPDDAQWAKYQAGGGKLSRDDWRRSQVDQFVERMYREVKREKRWVKVGISPFGIYRPGIPAGIQGFDQYAQLYADALKWYREGWCDYWTPQLYWPIAQTPQSFTTLLDWWDGQNVKGRHFWPGMFSSQIAPQNANWNRSEVIDQITETRKRNGVTGHVHFSFRVFTQDAKGIVGALKTNLYSERALVPASPWLGGRTPAAPRVGRPTATGEAWTVPVSGLAADARFVAAVRDGDVLAVGSAKDPALTIRRSEAGPSGLESVQVVVVDRTGLVGAPAPLGRTDR